MKTDLRFREDRSFTIVQLTDTHICDKPRNAETYNLFDLVVRCEDPDLVVLSGDIVHATACADPLVHWRDVVAFFDGKGVPWAFVYGNHDAEEYDAQLIDDALARSTLCLYEPGPPEVFGRGNYALSVLDHADDDVKAVVWSFDSGMGAEGVPSGYDWVKEDQIAWFRRHSDLLTDRRNDVTGLAFVHIPLQQHETVWQRQVCTGFKHEKVCMQGRDVGLFDAFREEGRIVACFVGHDHVNDYEGALDGVDLCYGRVSGYNGYGRDGFRPGARVINLTEGVRGYTSYVRLDDGSIADRPSHDPDSDV